MVLVSHNHSYIIMHWHKAMTTQEGTIMSTLVLVVKVLLSRTWHVVWSELAEKLFAGVSIRKSYVFAE